MYFSSHDILARRKKLEIKWYDVLREDGVHPNLSGFKPMEPLVQDTIQRSLKRKH